MGQIDYTSLLPIIVIGYASAILMAIVPFWRSRTAALVITLLTLAAAFALIFVAARHIPVAVTPLIQIDAYSLFFSGLLIAVGMLVALLSHGYLTTHSLHEERFYVLLLFAVLGMVATASSSHFISFVLGLETLSVALYGLIGFTRRYKHPLEAAMKYLVMAAVSSAFLLFGIALVYAEFGTMDFRLLLPLLTGTPLSITALFGIALILVGFGFKLALAPFHTWSPDVYQGAPAPVTALIASGSKAAVLALLLRLVMIGGLNVHSPTFVMLAVLCVGTMSVGNLLALMQTNVKRLLAYSSVAQLGYLLIPLIAGGFRSHSSLIFYLAMYAITEITAFGVITIYSSARRGGDLDDFEAYHALVYRRPWLAIALSLALMSLTGIPFTAGFFAKVYIFSAAAGRGLWWLLIVGAINAGVSAFYYLRLLVTLYAQPREQEAPAVRPTIASAAALAIAAAIIVFLGVYPTPLISLANAAARSLPF